ncbi:MAG: hypothetical protein MK135_09420, partial [Polyangiaceae bacterium]|nr:hypothetical protein [Polyangiaceae bacterium]
MKVPDQGTGGQKAGSGEANLYPSRPGEEISQQESLEGAVPQQDFVDDSSTQSRERAQLREKNLKEYHQESNSSGLGDAFLLKELFPYLQPHRLWL